MSAVTLGRSSRSDLVRAAQNLLLRWRDDPVRFADEVLGTRLWDKQAQIARSVVVNKRTAAKSGHKIGKSTGDAALAIWWPVTHARGRTILTAPSWHQVKNILWPEVRRLYREAKFSIGGICHKDPASGLELPGDRGIICISTDDAVKLAGLSGENLFFIVDEASGYDEKLWPAIFGNLAGGGMVLATGNPTQTSGTFFEAFGEKRHLWNTYSVSSAETPNVVHGRKVVPGLAMREFVLEHLDEYAGVRLPQDAPLKDILEALDRVGDSSPFISIRIKGEFPKQAKDAVVKLFLVEMATRRFPETAEDGQLEIGVDVARFGDDDSVIQPRRGYWAPKADVVHGLDTVQVAGKVLEVARRHLRPHERPRIKVDVIGVGAGVADLLRTHADLDVVDVNVAEAADSAEPGKPEFALLRDQIWFGVADWIKAGGAIEPGQGKLEAELAAPTYSFDVKGRIKVESKDEMKKRLHRSPDRAEALALSIHRGDDAGDLGLVVANRGPSL